MATKNLKTAKRDRLQARISKALEAQRQADESKAHNAEVRASGRGVLVEVPEVDMPAEVTPWWMR